MKQRVLPLVHAWLVLDFFAESRRSGGQGSTLTTTIFTQSFLALIFAALLYPETPAVPFAAANLSFSTLLVGLGALSDVQQQNRRAADRVLVDTSPLSRWTLTWARVLHGAFHLCLVTIGMALPPAILLLWVAGGAWIVPAYVALACLLAGIATGALYLLVTAVEAWAGSGRSALLAGTLKAVLLAAGVIAFATCLRALQGTADDLPIGRTGALLLPPYWAARFLHAPASDWYFLAALLALAAMLYGLSLLLPSGERPSRWRVGRERSLARLDRRLARRGPLLGVVAFTSAMLFRSAGFRARVLPLFGMPVAMVLLAVQDASPQARGIFLGMALQFPAIYLPFLVAFLPHTDQEDTRWVFATSPETRLSIARRASLISLTTHVLLPVHGAALAAMLLFGVPWLDTAALSTFSAGVSVLVAERQVLHLHAVPFTSATDEEAATEFGGIVGYAVILALLGAGFALVPVPALSLATGGAVLVVAAFRLTRLHAAP